MTWSDPIVEEVRRVRDGDAARFNYDLRAIFRDLKEQENRSGRQFVSYAADGTAPNEALAGMADDLFQTLDAEESDGKASESR